MDQHPVFQAALKTAAVIDLAAVNIRDDERFRNRCGVTIRPEHKEVYGPDLSWEEMVITDINGITRIVLFLPLVRMTESGSESQEKNIMTEIAHTEPTPRLLPRDEEIPARQSQPPTRQKTALEEKPPRSPHD